MVESICAAFAYQMHVDGSFSGDPHPGNILVQPLPAGQTAAVLDLLSVQVGGRDALQLKRRNGAGPLIVSARLLQPRDSDLVDAGQHSRHLARLRARALRAHRLAPVDGHRRHVLRAAVDEQEARERR